MFEKFKPDEKKLTSEDQNIIDEVCKQVPIVEHAQNEHVVPDGPDENKHPVRSVDDITKLRDDSANPHDFKEVT